MWSITSDGEIIESSDIYLVGDETRAKHYSAERFIDDDVSCGYGEIYACFLKPLRGFEASTGGPFARDIRLNFDTFQDVTYYMNHGENGLDPIRLGFHGPYIFVFADEVPALEDYEDISFLEGLGLSGYVGESGRGSVSGEIQGTSSDLPIVVHWYNDNYQQWVYASEDGSFESPALIEGTYTMAAYQDELLAATSTVEITAGSTATASLTASNPIITEERTTLFQIGIYDGRPVGLLNADKQQRMHPTDQRMGEWAAGTFTVGESSDEDFPMALFQDVNSGQEIVFNLDEAVGEIAKIRIATTITYKGGIPAITVNDFECPSFEAPSYTTEGRGLTKGKTHGGMDVYECEVESSVLVAGANTVTIGVESSDSGDAFLSPNFMIDAIELYY